MSASARSWTGRLGLALTVIVVLLAVLGPWLCRMDPDAIDRTVALRAPDPTHLLGTDDLGRDVLARVLVGLRRSGLAALAVLAGATTLALLVGVAAALGEGQAGRTVDTVLMRIVDIVLAVPSLVVALAIVGVLGPGFGNLLVALLFSAWAAQARVVRAFALRVRDRPYVVAARLAGSSAPAVAVGHLLPAVLPHVAVVAALRMGTVVVGLAGLSFLGLGAQPPTAELGALLGAARPFLSVAPWMMIGPVVAVLLLTAAATLLAESLRGDGIAR